MKPVAWLLCLFGFVVFGVFVVDVVEGKDSAETNLPIATFDWAITTLTETSSDHVFALHPMPDGSIHGVTGDRNFRLSNNRNVFPADAPLESLLC